MAGGVCGNVWGAYRVTLADQETAPSANPFHDMIY